MADDSILFFKAIVSNCACILSVLKDYEKASGQSINFNKSALLLSPNNSNDFKSYIQSILGFNLTTDLGIYLGLPSLSSKNKSMDYNFLIDKIGKTTQLWKSKLLSIGGKEVFIKSIAQALHVYYMSCFRLPKKVYDSINRCLGKFWWGSNNNSK